MSHHDRRDRWQIAVFLPRPGLSHSHRVVLLYLARFMNANGIVSVPRTKLADDLGMAPARITEAITAGRRFGFLDTVKRGRPGTTAVYQAIIPRTAEVRNPYHPEAERLVRKPGGDLVRDPYLKTGSRGTESGQPSSGSAAQESSPPADLESRRAAMTSAVNDR